MASSSSKAIFSIVLTLASLANCNTGIRGKIRTGHYPDPNREEKLFSLFTLVNFRNVGCQSTSSFSLGSGTTNNFRNGTCYTSSECSSRGGSGQGGCAAGFGVCCVFIASTGGSTISQNCTYVQNPSYPSTDNSFTTTQTYTVQRCSNNICSLRLDFENFMIDGTTDSVETTGGVCSDTFVVTTNTNQDIPVICGENTGYHMYIDIGANSGNTASLTFTLPGTAFGRSWDIKVTQIECSNPNKPPNGCLQYHTGYTGRIESFNYNPNTNTETHLANQNYRACIRAEEGMCCVQYMVCGDQIGTTTVQPGFSLNTDASKTTSIRDDSCLTTDYVGIPLSSDTCQSGLSTLTGTVASRYCGAFFNFNTMVAANGVICDCTEPFTVDICTNDISDVGSSNAAPTASAGLCLEYTQIPCN